MANSFIVKRVRKCERCGVQFLAKTTKRKFCDPCVPLRKKEMDKQYHVANAEIRRARVSIWQKANPERVRANRAQWKLDNPELAAERAKQKYKREAGKRRIAAREWYAANRKKVLARMASEDGRKYAREKMKERMKNPHIKLHSVISRAIRVSLKDKRRRRWETLVGYSLEQLMAHLERQFTRGMSWKNHGKGNGFWHIDHIVPRAAFTYDTVDDPDFKACWALTNLRPLWQKENISKHASREFLL